MRLAAIKGKTIAALLVAAAAFLVGCRAEGEVSARRGAAHASPDTVLDLVRDPWRSGSPLTLRRTLSVGEGEGERGTLLHDVTDALLLSNRLVVANSGSREVIAFEPDGRTAWRAGGEGDGPGEFRGELRLATMGDTLIVYDRGTRRATRYSSTGRLLGTIDFKALAPNPALVCFADEHWIFTTHHMRLSPGANRDSVVIGAIPDERSTPSLPDVRTLAALEGEGVWLMFLEGFPVVDTRPMTSRPSFSCADGLVSFTAADSGVVRIVDVHGGTRLVVRWTSVPDKLPPDARQRWMRSGADAPDAAVPGREDWLADVELPAAFPALADAVLEGDSALWVSEYVPPWATRRGVSRVDLYSGTTRRVTMDAGMQLWRVHGRRLVVGHRDELGVERVVVFTVEN